jgi:hypothetical protein
MYSSLGTSPSSTQAFLGTVAICPCCKSQRPKETFRMVDGESICKRCQDELEEEPE